MLLAADDLVALVSKVNDVIAGVGYDDVTHFIARQFLWARHNNNLAVRDAVGPAALWSSLNHPRESQGMREAVSGLLRREGRAHITWHFSGGGLALGVSDKFLDLDGLISVWTDISAPEISRSPQTQH